MKTCIVISLLLNLAIAQPIDFLNPEGRIFGGQDADISDFPYQVSLWSLNGFYCAGSIIAEEWVITAAHCLYEYEESDISIHAGTTYSDKKGIVAYASKFYINPNYNQDSHDNDVALIKTVKPMMGPNLSPISLPYSDYEVKDGTTAIISGWGYLNEEQKILDNHLKYATVKTINWKSCNEALAFRGGISPKMLCGTTNKSNTCPGDSGGPYVVDNILIGVTSFGFGYCEHSVYPAVYTRLADPEIRQWIKNTSGI